VTTTLSDTDSAIYTALSALQINVTTGTTAARPFALVGRFAGALDEDSIREVVTQWPAALLAFGGESVTRTVSTLAGDSEDRGTVRWTVYVAAEDPRAIDDGVVGTSTAPGSYILTDAVLAALNGLPLSGAWFSRTLRTSGVREALIRRGVVYVYAIDFEAMRALPQVTPPASSVTLADIRGDVNIPFDDGDDNPDNPRVQFVADTDT